MSLNTLTPEQQEACDKFLGFLLSEEKEFYLFGAAGCGKTFLTQHFISELVDKYKNTAKMLGLPITDYVVAVTATTNKAVEVLNQGKVFNGDLYVETIYKLLGIVVKEDYSTGKTYLTDTNKQLVIYDSIIFIDECSMLPTQMLNYIRKKTKNCKIIFIGDSYQLAPVNEKPHWNSTPENVTVSLKTPVRNQNKASLISLCSQLRKNVDDNTAITINTVPGEIEHLTQVEVSNWLNNFDPEKQKVLCYTNHTAVKYNDFISKCKGFTKPHYEGNIYINNSMTIPNWSKTVRYYPEEQIKINKLNKYEIIFFGDISFGGYSAQISSVNNPKKRSNVYICYNYNQVKRALKQCADKNNWTTYFNIQNQVMDLRLPYASTIHKAQGNTYDEVLIDLDSFKSCTDPDVAARLLYVAVSRAKNKVLFYGSLPKKFGEVV